MDGKWLVRGTSLAVLAAAAPFAVAPTTLQVKVNEACASSGQSMCCPLPGSWCYQYDDPNDPFPVANKFWWWGLNCPKT